MNKSRLEAFSDGVFAIVITLLILNVKLPETDYSHLAGALIAILPSVGVYILSFLLVGMYWAFHHYSFSFIKQVDGVLLWLNILFLLFISFMPFPTLLMGRFPFRFIPIAIYGSNLLLANATGFIMLIYLRRNKDLANEIFTATVFNTQVKIYISINLAYLLCIFLGIYLPAISFIILAIMAFLLILRSIKLSGIGKCEKL
jgi:uncharacterized membrane protein